MCKDRTMKILLVITVVCSLITVFIFNTDVLAVGTLDNELGPKTALKLSIPIYLVGSLSVLTAMILIIRREKKRIGDGSNDKI